METDEARNKLAEILRDNIKFSGQVGDYIIHGAIDEIIKWHESELNQKQPEKITLQRLMKEWGEDVSGDGDPLQWVVKRFILIRKLKENGK